VAYHKTVMLWQARVNGMVRCTAVASRLRACPGAEGLVRVFDRNLDAPSACVALDGPGRAGGGIGGGQGDVVAAVRAVADKDDLDGAGAEDPVPQAGTAPPPNPKITWCEPAKTSPLPPGKQPQVQGRPPAGRAAARP